MENNILTVLFKLEDRKTHTTNNKTRKGSTDQNVIISSK